MAKGLKFSKKTLMIGAVVLVVIVVLMYGMKEGFQGVAARPGSGPPSGSGSKCPTFTPDIPILATSLLPMSGALPKSLPAGAIFYPGNSLILTSNLIYKLAPVPKDPCEKAKMTTQLKMWYAVYAQYVAVYNAQLNAANGYNNTKLTTPYFFVDSVFKLLQQSLQNLGVPTSSFSL